MARVTLTRAQKRAVQLSKEFHALLGYCIAEWANVDDALFEIFRQCVGPYEQSAILYFRMPGLDVRLGTVDELLLSRYPKKKPGEHTHRDIQQWDELRKNVQNLLSVRRRLAHQRVKESWNTLAAWALEIQAIPFDPKSTGFDALHTQEPWHAVLASEHERVREKSSDLKPLTKIDLEKHFKQVGELSGELAFFAHGTLPLHLAKPPPPARRPTLGTLPEGGQVHPTIRKRRPQPSRE